MTFDILLVLFIILVAVILFVSGRLRVDLVALMVLGALVLTGLITPSEAVSGFSNPAVITVWAVFILSGGLTRTGVANVIGNQVMRVAGNGQFRLLFLIMLTAALLSAFMNNVGVAALLLPVVMDIARRTKISPSKLLMPLAFGALLGGLMTLIGTPPNILASDALRDNGFEPFELFDFARVGTIIMSAGLLFMVFIGQRLLPTRNRAKTVTDANGEDLNRLYQLEDRILILRLPESSRLGGKTLADSKLGSMVDLNVIAIMRHGRSLLSPSAQTELQAGDRLLVIGLADQLTTLRQHQVDIMEEVVYSEEHLRTIGISVVIARIPQKSPFAGQSLEQSDFRIKYGLNVTAIRRGDHLMHSSIRSTLLQAGDVLVVEGTDKRITALRESGDFEITEPDEREMLQLNESLMRVRIPAESSLVGSTLADSRLGRNFGLTVLQIYREDQTLIFPEAAEEILPDDILMVHGSEENLASIRGLEELEFEQSVASLEELESAGIQMAEAILSPHTTLTGKSLSDLRFRERYGLNVLAIWRGGRAYRRNFREMDLRLGDALLLYGTRDKFRLLGSDPNFVVLTEADQEEPRIKKAPVAVGIMVAVLATVLIGWLPIAIAAVIGATVMVLTGSLTMDEAYRYIEWPAVFLIAAMLPLGIALQNSGAAQFLADSMMAVLGDFGPLIVLAGLFILTVLASQVMPNAAVVVLMAPIAIAAATDLDISVRAFMMGIAIAASASFLSPVSHPANVLVMGPGGYRFSDYIKVGLPLTVLVFVIVLIFLPIFWPF